MIKAIGNMGLTALMFAIIITALPAAPSTYGEAKAFTLPDSTGHKVSLSDFKGKVVLLDFWATWCRPCRQSMPHLQKLYQNYAQDGLVVIGINMEGSERNVLRYIADGGYTFTILFDRSKQVSRNYRVRGIPHSVLIDRNGYIQYIGHPLGIEDSQLQELLELGFRDRKTGRLITAEVGSEKGAKKEDRKARAAQQSYNEGMEQKRVGNFGRAAELFQDAIEADPRHVAAHKEYVGLMRMMGKGETLLNTYREWIADDPDNAVLHYAFGLALGEQNAEERARAFKKALALNPNFTEAQQALEMLKQ